jgi:tRNA G18 (ribose-2'-O)-methylase SpoU
MAYLTGITKTPPFGKELSKTSRNKEKSVTWKYLENFDSVINKLKSDGFVVVGVELTEDALEISELKTKLKDTKKICLILGNEVHGIKRTTIQKTDLVTFIPMYGRGASLNVSASLAIALFSI